MYVLTLLKRHVKVNILLHNIIFMKLGHLLKRHDIVFCQYLHKVDILLCPPPLKKDGHIALHLSVGMSVGRYVGIP